MATQVYQISAHTFGAQCRELKRLYRRRVAEVRAQGIALPPGPAMCLPARTWSTRIEMIRKPYTDSPRGWEQCKYISGAA